MQKHFNEIVQGFFVIILRYVESIKLTYGNVQEIFRNQFTIFHNTQFYVRLSRFLHQLKYVLIRSITEVLWCS